MSIEFNRRTFLKTGAALIGATALVGLTGCDSSSSSSHPINKSVTFEKTYTLGDVGVKLELPISDGEGNPGQNDYYVSAELTISNLSDAPITLGMDSMSATYKGASLPFRSVAFGNGVRPSSSDKTLTLQKKGTKDQDFADINITFKLPDKTASVDDVVLNLHYGKKSIRFQTRNTNTYTSDVYTD